MEKVCNQIPETISEDDRETSVTRIFLQRLKVTHDEYPEPPTSQRHHFPHKQQPVAAKNSHIFHVEYIFCVQVEIRLAGKAESSL